MCTQEQQQRHKRIFDWFEEKRKNDGLYYSVRLINRNGRLEQGYIFLGNDDYVGVPLVDHRDIASKISSIQIVFGKSLDFCYLEFVSRNCAHGKNDIEFYGKMMEFDKKIQEYVKNNENAKIKEIRCKPDEKEYCRQLLFKGGKNEKAFFDKAIAFWMEFGVPFWKDYFKSPEKARSDINRSLQKIDSDVKKTYDWPESV